MSLTFSNECVGCPPEMGCLGSACKYRNVPHISCDKCNDNTDKLYNNGSGWICLHCLLKEEGIKYLEDDTWQYEDEIYDWEKLMDYINDNFESIGYDHLPEPEEPDYDDWED